MVKLKWMKNNQGFTLVELLVVIAISSVILVAAFTFLLSNQTAFISVMARMEAQKSARNAMDQVITSIRRSDQAALAKIESGNSLTVNIPGNDTDQQFFYDVERDENTGEYQFIMKKEDVSYVITSDMDGAESFVVKNENQVIYVKIRTKVKKYNQVAWFETENYHRIKIDVE